MGGLSILKKNNIKIIILSLIVISTLVFPTYAVSERNHPSTIKNSTASNIETPQLYLAYEWVPNGSEISTENGNQWYPQISGDGANGAIITWEDERDGEKGDIYAQRINSAGDVQWVPGGVAISTENDTQGSPQICSDEDGGAIITWNDKRNGLYYDIYAQRINSTGSVIWDVNGTEISTAIESQTVPQITSDGTGGAIITWSDYRSGSNYDIYVQRINSTGNVKWIANGTSISSESGNQYFPQITSDGAGGAILTWEDLRGADSDIYAQRIDSTGNVMWNANGTAISTAYNDQWYPQITSDGAGGAIITWSDYRTGTNYDIYAQRINSTGNVMWFANGTEISTAGDNQEVPQICSDGAEGAIITWTDFRNGNNYDIYAQKINSTGSLKWIINGIAVNGAEEDQEAPQISDDGEGGAIITWEDSRDIWGDIYAQRVSSAGEIQGTAEGVDVCTAGFAQRQPQIYGDGNGSAIITWFDKRNIIDYDIFANWVKIEPSLDGDKAFPIEIIIIISSTIGGVAIVGIATFFILKKRRKIEQ